MHLLNFDVVYTRYKATIRMPANICQNFKKRNGKPRYTGIAALNIKSINGFKLIRVLTYYI